MCAMNLAQTYFSCILLLSVSASVRAATGWILAVNIMCSPQWLYWWYWEGICWISCVAQSQASVGWVINSRVASGWLRHSEDLWSVIEALLSCFSMDDVKTSPHRVTGERLILGGLAPQWFSHGSASSCQSLAQNLVGYLLPQSSRSEELFSISAALSTLPLSSVSF